MTTPPPEGGFEIDPVELGAHQQRLAGLVDRTRTAREAAVETIQPMAFGVFGAPMALKCVESQLEGASMLATAHAATEEHHRKVGSWLHDLTENELNISSLFATEVIGNA
ncbi:MAG: hypothetical protein GEV28_41065 [Actinophytocola sp.]|uniref:hypothetical protein n=1 Tax=Actinophytocola sp. TaxID=1872138 RepID=UPI001329847E|nr:hypothetical protein [Actinophytocola sp.]MPZ86427.1 hypothetical protein [Actinophytocola sp.]